MPNDPNNSCAELACDWADDVGLWLSLDMEMNRQSGHWTNVSWLPKYPHWVYVQGLPTIGPYSGIPLVPKLSIDVLKTHQRLAELRKIWSKYN